MNGLRKDLTTAAVAIVFLTLVFGVAYPLVTTGVAQLVFPGAADGSRIEHGRQGRRLAADRPGLQGSAALLPEPPVGDRIQRQTSPSSTTSDPTAASSPTPSPNSSPPTCARERPYDPGLGAGEVPVDAVTTSASGRRPPHLAANARIQARRVAAVRGLPLATGPRSRRRAHRRPLPRRCSASPASTSSSSTSPSTGEPPSERRDASQPKPRSLLRPARSCCAPRSTRCASSTRATSSATRSCSWSRSAPRSPPSAG